jgi:hypothetical protein
VLSRMLSVYIALAMLSFPAVADTVRLKDGRVFKGDIIQEDSEAGVRIDTMVSGIRAQIHFEADEIQMVTREEIPPTFFGKPQASERRSDPGSFAPDATLYLEVPLVGRFGREITADGINDVLRYAERHRVQHIVFVIDSPGGELDETARIYDAMGEYDDTLVYHALVRNCRGNAMAVAVRCDTFFMEPGAVIGGADATNIGDDGEVSDILLAQIAYELGTQAERRFRAGRMVRAMVDPAESYVAWLDEDGTIIESSEVPEGVEADAVIIQAAQGDLLRIDEPAARALDVPIHTGGVTALGSKLGFDAWQRESDYGRHATRLATRSDDCSLQEEYELKVRDNIANRESVKRYIDQNFAAAAETDPSKGNYQEYSTRLGWGWGGGSYTRYNGNRSGNRSGSRYGNDGGERRRSQRQPNEFTSESLRTWRNRCDLAAKYLGNALQGVEAMVELETEARELGLEPIMEMGDLVWMADDAKAKISFLKSERNRRGR